MLETVDLSLETPKEQFRRVFPEMEARLRRLQYACREAKVPVIIVLEGWDAAGKGTLISSLIERLDPRGYKVHATHGPTLEEAMRPFLWRFWLKLPNDGDWAIFDRSWYGRVFVERFEKFIKRRAWERAWDEINQFERQLADHGTVLVKLFLHISKKEQKRRMKELLADKYQRWKVEKKDLRNHRAYEAWRRIYDETFEKTSTTWAPWTIVEAEDRRYATLKAVETITAAVEEKLRQKKTRAQVVSQAPLPKLRTNPRTLLDRVDLSVSLEEDAYKTQLAKYQARFRELSFQLFKHRIPCVIGFEGWDAAGKGGAIKRLIAPLDPRAYDVIPIGVPKGEEFTHHYLWRFWRHFPKAGHIAVFDRTWYGRVLIERVDHLSGDAWKRAYQEINEFEAMMVSFGAVLCKFWIHISKQEQLRRFRERERIEYKRYKITPDDWHNRSKWNDYERAVGEAIIRTSTTYAPWTIVEGNQKRWARVKVLRTVCEAIEKRLE